MYCIWLNHFLKGKKNLHFDIKALFVNSAKFKKGFIIGLVRIPTIKFSCTSNIHRGSTHGLRTPNEGINQRNLKIWANVANKLCLLHPRIWEWELIFGRAAKAISSSGLHSPWVYIFKRDLQTISLHCTAIFSYVYYKCIKGLHQYQFGYGISRVF